MPNFWLVWTGIELNQRNKKTKSQECCDDFLSCRIIYGGWDDRTHAVVVSHVTYLLLPEGWHANTYCSADSREKSEAGIMLILSDGSICGIVASNQPVTNRASWLLAIQLLCLFCSWPISTFTVLITLVSAMAQSHQSLNECKIPFLFCSVNCEWCRLQVVWGIKKM